MKKKFTSEELKDAGLPYEAPEGGEIISREITDTSRWSIHYSLIFRFADMAPGEAWEVSYSKGATETQDERPWEYEREVEATLVHQVEKVVKVWEPKPEGGAS